MLIEVIDNIKEYEYLVIAKSSRGLLLDLKELNLYFKENNIKNTKFIIDSLIVVGNNENRFIIGEYVNGRLSPKSIKEEIIPLDSEIRIKSMKFFNNNEDLVRNSILNNSIKKLLIYGAAI